MFTLSIVYLNTEANAASSVYSSLEGVICCVVMPLCDGQADFRTINLILEVVAIKKLS